MDNKNENWRKKKHVKPKCDCKRKKGRKIKNLGIIELKIKKNTFFPIIKNHNSITTPKKINPFLPTKKIADSSTWFFYCCFFCLVLCLPLFFWAIFGKSWLCYYSTIITTYYYYYMLMCNLCSMHIKSRFEYKKTPLNPPKSNYVKCQNTPNFAQCTKLLSTPPQNKNEKKVQNKTPFHCILIVEIIAPSWYFTNNWFFSFLFFWLKSRIIWILFLQSRQKIDCLKSNFTY